MDMNPDLKIVIEVAKVAVKVLSHRALTWATMLLTAAMFAFSLYDPSPMRIAAATIFGLLVFWRVTWIEKIAKGEGHANTTE